jgi:hypothetical protein
MARLVQPRVLSTPDVCSWEGSCWERKERKREEGRGWEGEEEMKEGKGRKGIEREGLGLGGKGGLNYFRLPRVELFVAEK